MSRAEDIAAAESEAIHNRGIKQVKRGKADAAIMEISRLVEEIKERGGDVTLLLDKMQAVVDEGRKPVPYDPYDAYNN